MGQGLLCVVLALDGGSGMTLWDHVWLIVIDKLIIGLLIAGVGYFISRLLQEHRTAQDRMLELFKTEQSRTLELLKGEQSRALELLKAEQTLRRDAAVLRDQTTLRHLQRQIEELYSPLLALLQTEDEIYKLMLERIGHDWKAPAAPTIWTHFMERHFLPLNRQITELIRTRIYLIDTDQIPASFRKFMAHHTQTEALHELWKEKKIDSWQTVKMTEWPDEFGRDVEVSLAGLRQRYNSYLRKIQARMGPESGTAEPGAAADQPRG
jgi:hypothetical protein